MNRQILKKPQVEQDLVECFAYIARDKIEPAERFLRVAEESFQFLAANPFAGQRWDSPHADLIGIRVYTLPTPFRNYLVFFRPIDCGVEILTVFHGSRDLTTLIELLAGRE